MVSSWNGLTDIHQNRKKKVDRMESTFQTTKIYRKVNLNDHQAPAFSRILIRDGTGRDFAKSRDPGIFRDGINLIFSSRDWWDPGIFRDGISLKFSSRDFFKQIYSKTYKSLWNHCSVWYGKSWKIPGFNFPTSRDRDLSSIPGPQDIPRSRWGLAETPPNSKNWVRSLKNRIFCYF